MNTTEVTTTNPAAGWFADPLARNEHRYWDGTTWTDHVSNGGLITVDPIASTTPVVEQVASTPTVGSTPTATPAVGEAASAAASAAAKAASAAIESLTAKVGEASKRHTPRQMAVAGVALVVLVLGTFFVGTKVVHMVTPGGGNFCGDARAMAQKYAGINQFDVQRSDMPELHRVGEEMKQLAGEAPNEIKADLTAMADETLRVTSGESPRFSSREIDAMSTRVSAYEQMHCQTVG